MFKEVADIKTSDQLDLPVPEADFETVVVQPSEIQKEMVASLSERAAKVHSGSVDPSVDNMLKITSDGRKIGLDQRLMNPLLPDDPGSKLNACVNNVFRIWEEGNDRRLTQLVFCDLSTPKMMARLMYTMTSKPNWQPGGFLKQRSLSSMTRIRKQKRKNSLPKSAPVRVCFWAVPRKWGQGRMCRTG